MQQNEFSPINVSRKVAAEMLGISVPTFDALCRRQENPIPFFRVGNAGAKILCPVDALRRWAEDEAKRQHETEQKGA